MLISEKVNAFIFGIIVYDDVFGVHHITQFSYQYWPKLNACMPHGTFNDAD